MPIETKTSYIVVITFTKNRAALPQDKRLYEYHLLSSLSSVQRNRNFEQDRRCVKVRIPRSEKKTSEIFCCNVVHSHRCTPAQSDYRCTTKNKNENTKKVDNKVIADRHHWLYYSTISLYHALSVIVITSDTKLNREYEQYSVGNVYHIITTVV